MRINIDMLTKQASAGLSLLNINSSKTCFGGGLIKPMMGDQ